MNDQIRNEYKLKMVYEFIDTFFHKSDGSTYWRVDEMKVDPLIDFIMKVIENCPNGK